MRRTMRHLTTPFLTSRRAINKTSFATRFARRLVCSSLQNYLHFDGFVVLTGTDTMAYSASALSFMLENLGKPVIFTGSQIPLCEAYNDARRNLIMSLIFASRDTINEVRS